MHTILIQQMKNAIILLIVLLFINNQSNSQELLGIKDPGTNYYNKCKNCIELLKKTPNEISYDLYTEDETIYFYTNSEEWFNQMFKSSKDGIALQIVSKERYSCANEKLNKKTLLRGKQISPMFRKELKKNMIKNEGSIFIKLYDIPEKYSDKDVEYNLILINKGYYCYSKNSIQLQSYRWDLVDMGFFMDTLTYRTNFDSNLNPQEKYILQHKKLLFTIPFEKNKSEYSQEDIQALYDSLELTNFNIKTISIRSYSSVEGETKRNLELQNLRSNSIAIALQQFQNPTIVTNITTSENWVEFLNDISGTKYAYLANLSKNGIKDKLKSKKLTQELEAYLKNHRKAVVVLELQKKDKYKDLTSGELITVFNESVQDKNLDKAIEIQNSIFEKIENAEIPVSTIQQLTIPKQTEFGTLLNKNIMFQFFLSQTEIYETLLKLEELESLLPKDGHVKYNICAIKFKVWLLGEQAIDPIEFKKQITNLSKYKISSTLIKRLLINYHIIMSEHFMKNGDFVNKDKSLKYIYSNYKYTPLTDVDYLSIAQYLSSYTKYDWATKILAKRVKNINVDEDLLFYYLNLTLRDSKLTKRSTYRTIMLNAINLNPNRYCKIFDAKSKGGASFQLLENDYLRKTYCENCND